MGEETVVTLERLEELLGGSEEAQVVVHLGDDGFAAKVFGSERDEYVISER